MQIIMPLIVEAKKISVQYGRSKVLEDVSFVVENGDYIGLVGPNGAGKTTLIKALLGLLPLSSGSMKIFGQPRNKFNGWSKIGYLPQKISLVNSLFPATVEEVVLLGLLSQKKWPKRINKNDVSEAEKILTHLKIVDLKSKMLSELSGGQQQKVMIARALAAQPELLIFDEPSASLDPESRKVFFHILRDLNKKDKIAIILITHDTSHIGHHANKLLYLDRKVIFFGDFTDFCQSPAMSTHFGEHEKHVVCHPYHHHSLSSPT